MTARILVPLGAAALRALSASAQAAGFVETKNFAPAPTAKDGFGRSVAIAGDVVAVGADRGDDHDHRSGSACLFDTPARSRIAALAATDRRAGDPFGGSVAISGDVAVVDARLDGGDGVESGSACLFNAVTSAQIAGLAAPDGAPGARPHDAAVGRGRDPHGRAALQAADRDRAGATRAPDLGPDDEGGRDGGSPPPRRPRAFPPPPPVLGMMAWTSTRSAPRASTPPRPC